ncbi:MAG: AEC family transporter [Spirochaetales bacterium]|nr:AEC family transporter [Spirochaetales bacterium]
MADFNYTFAVSLAIIATGFILKQAKVLSVDHGKALSRVIINVTLPALILTTVSTIDLDFSLFMAPVICGAFSLGVALISMGLFKHEAPAEQGPARMSSVGFNIGLFAYPLIQGLFGTEGLSVVAMFDVGNAFIVFGVSYLLGYLSSSARRGRPISITSAGMLFLTSIPFMSYVTAVTMNLTGLSFPPFAADVLHTLAKANTGMALVVLGLTLDVKFDKKHLSLIMKVVGLRYAAGFTAGILLYLFLPFPAVYRTVILFALLFPVGLAVIPYSAEFDYDVAITGTIANITIIASFTFMWLFMLIFSPG